MFIKDANGAALTRELIRTLKHPVEEGAQARQKEERRHQDEEHGKALRGLCRQLEQEKEELERRYTELCREIGKEPQPFSAPLVPEEGHRSPPAKSLSGRSGCFCCRVDLTLPAITRSGQLANSSKRLWRSSCLPFAITMATP